MENEMDYLEQLRRMQDQMMGQEQEIPMAPEQQDVQAAITDSQTAQINEKAKDDNQLTKPELIQKTAEQEASRTVAGQLDQSKDIAAIPSPEAPESIKKLTDMEMLIQNMDKVRADSKIERKEAQDRDQNRMMLENAMKALGTIGQAELQRNSGVAGNIDKFKAVKAVDTASGVNKERDSILNELMAKHKLLQADKRRQETSKEGYLTQAQKFQQGENEANRKAKKDIAKLGNKKTGQGLTEAQVAVDKDYGKLYNKFTDTGRTNASHAISQLEKLQKEVSSDTGFGEAGGTRLPIPDMMRSRLAIERRDDARNFANTTLKELFGGQLSDAEREAAAREFWNDSLDNESNAKRLASKIKNLKDNLTMQTKKAAHYEKTGSLGGFEGTSEIKDTAPKKIRVVGPDGEDKVVPEDRVLDFLKKYPNYKLME